MKYRRKFTAAAAVSILAVAVPLAIQVDRWIIERRQLEAHVQFEREVANCEYDGGRWFRGDCLDPAQ